MVNFKVEYVKRVTCDLSASEWGLYTSTFPRAEIESVADSLNDAFMKYFNEDKLSREELLVKMDRMQASFAKYGANDTEPRTVLWHLSEKAYNYAPVALGA